MQTAVILAVVHPNEETPGGEIQRRTDSDYQDLRPDSLELQSHGPSGEKMQRQFSAEQIVLPDIRQRLTSWTGHAVQADTHRLRNFLFRTITFQRATAE